MITFSTSIHADPVRVEFTDAGHCLNISFEDSGYPPSMRIFCRNHLLGKQAAEALQAVIDAHRDTVDKRTVVLDLDEQDMLDYLGETYDGCRARVGFNLRKELGKSMFPGDDCSGDMYVAWICIIGPDGTPEPAPLRLAAYIQSHSRLPDEAWREYEGPSDEDERRDYGYAILAPRASQEAAE